MHRLPSRPLGAERLVALVRFVVRLCSTCRFRFDVGARLRRSPTLAARPCVPLLGALSVGTWLGRETTLDPARWWGAAVAALVAWNLLRSGRPRGASACVLAAVAFAGAGWSSDRWRTYDGDELGLSLDQTPAPLTIEAQVRRGPRYRPGTPSQPLASIPRGDETQMLVEVERLRDGRRWRRATGSATVRVDGHVVGIHAGDRVRIHGLGATIAPPLNPGEEDFAAHARGRRTLGRIHASHPDAVELLVRGSPWRPRRLLDEVRRRGVTWLQRHLPPRESGLALAVLLGAREELDETRSEAFFESGLAHLLAVSGLNVAIFAYGLWFVARLGLTPRRPTIALVALLALGYALLTDAEPPVLRAALLVAGGAAGRWLGRDGAGENTLAGAACVVLLLDPSSLFHAGAQLSFLAVAVLDQLAHDAERRVDEDPLERLLERSRSGFERAARRAWTWVRAGFATSGLVWLATAPLVWHRFHVISPIALILNPLVMLPMSVAMYAGAAALATAGAWPAAADLCGRICGVCLRWIEGAIDLGLRVPGDHVWLPAPPTPWIGAFYAAFAATVIEPRWRPPLAARCLLWAAWFGTAYVAATHGRTWCDAQAPRATGAPRLTFVAVGHGTAVLIESPDGRTLLYDAGRLGPPAAATRAVSAVLWSKGLRRLDAVIVSHADTDHYNAIPELAERFAVGAVYASPYMFEEDSPALATLRAALERRGVPLRTLSAGDRLWPDGPTTFDVWHPPSRGARGTDNSRSLVLAIERFGRRALLPGDLESPGLDELLAEPPRRCEAVMAPHHGSLKSNPRGFAAWTTPRHAVVSGSTQRDDPRLRREYEKSGCRVWHTGREGAIELRIRPEGVSARSLAPR